MKKKRKVDPFPLSSFEEALINGQKMIFYLPADEDSYRESVIRSIRRGVKVLQEHGFSVEEPEYQFVVGETFVKNGETDEEGKVVFHYSGSLCRD